MAAQPSGDGLWGLLKLEDVMSSQSIREATRQKWQEWQFMQKESRVLVSCCMTQTANPFKS
eukprot:368409-Pelagomonas_calceolata.AAC.1